MMRRVEKGFSGQDLFPNLFAGILSGLMTLIGSISYATLIFAGNLSSNLTLGIYSALVSASLIGLIMAAQSSSTLVIAGPDANISAILALIAASIVAGLGASASTSTVFSTLFAGLAFSAFLTGVFLFLVGRYRLGRWIRFIPYPVIGGFLAGTGWLLVRGSFKVMAGYNLSLDQAAILVQPANFIHWLPGALFAAVALALTRRFKQFYILPSLILAAILIAHLALRARGISIAQAGESGWLLSPPSRGSAPPVLEGHLAREHPLAGPDPATGQFKLAPDRGRDRDPAQLRQRRDRDPQRCGPGP